MESSTDNTESDIAIWPDNIPVPLIGRSNVVIPRAETTVMESGRPRVRRIATDQVELMNAQWNLTEDQYHLFREFHRVDLNQGEGFFQMLTYDVLDEPTWPDEITEVIRVCAFLDGNYNLSTEDNNYSVQATLLVESETRRNIVNPFKPVIPPPPPIILPMIVVVSYTTCKDEIQIDLPPIAGVLTVEVEVGPTADGPWEFWGETRKPETSITLSN
jgi:hypothetical protein